MVLQPNSLTVINAQKDPSSIIDPSSRDYIDFNWEFKYKKECLDYIQAR